MIYLLLFTVLLMLILSYVIFDFDLFSPSVVLCAAYLVSILAAVFNVTSWNIEYHLNSYLVIVSGISVFIFGEFLFRIFYNQKSKLTNLSTNKNVIGYIYVSKIKVLFIIGFQIITFILYVKQVYRISLLAGNQHGYSTMMSYYNYAINYMTLPSGQGPNFFVTQMYSFSLVFSYIMLYVFINNIIAENRKMSFLYIIPTIIFIATTFLTGSRAGIADLCIYAAVISYIFYNQKNGWKMRGNLKFIFKIILYFIGFMLIFFCIKQLVGRTDTTHFWNYTTGYIGGSIQLFDVYMQNPIPQTNLWGSETFFAIYKFLSKYGIVQTNIYRNLPFISLAGTPFNVYTAFRRYIDDFGVAGIIFPQLTMSIFYGFFYYHIKQYKNAYYKNLKIILYGFIFFPIVFHPFDEMFFSSLLSIGLITQLLIFLFVYKFLIPKDNKDIQKPPK